MNTISLTNISADKKTVTYQFEVKGDWKEYFIETEKIQIEFSESMDYVPESILAIPFVGAVLPLSWFKDATIETDQLDKDFYECISPLKNGFIKMIPMLQFNGDVKVNKTINNQTSPKKNAMIMFSGGVDAFTTFFRHLEEKPILCTVCGADMKLQDQNGWKNIYSLTQKTADDYDLACVYVKSPFREFLNETMLNSLIREKVHDNFWHALQHGIGLLSQAAPLAYIKNIQTVYIASSYPKEMIERGKVICSSDPRTDNCVKYFGCQVIHDGVEYTRQGKIHYIVEKTKTIKNDILLRVCFFDQNGLNCCRCEKCCRTILHLVAEGADPNKYGFKWDSQSIKRCKKDMKYRLIENPTTVKQSYPVIQKNLKIIKR